MMVYLFHRYSSGYGSEAMRQRYADEEKMFIPKLASVFTKMSMDTQTAESENDRKDRLVRRRSTLRLLAELLVAGVYTDGSILITALRDLIEQESKAIFADARTMLFTIVSGFVKYAGEDMLQFPPQWRVDAEALLTSYRRRRERSAAAVAGGQGANAAGDDAVMAEAGEQEPEGLSQETGAAELGEAAAAAAAADAAELEKEDEEDSANDDVLEALERERRSGEGAKHTISNAMEIESDTGSCSGTQSGSSSRQCADH